MKQVIKSFLIFILLTASCQLFAQEEQAQEFNPEQANAQLVQIQKEFKASSLSIAALTQQMNLLQGLQDKANDCVTTSEQQIKEVETVLTSLQASATDVSGEKNYQELQQKKSNINQQLSNCRLFVYSAQQTLDQYKATIQQVTAESLLARNTPIWLIYKPEILAAFSAIILSESTVVKEFLAFETLVQLIGLAIVVLSFCLGWYFRYLLRAWLKKAEDVRSELQPLAAVLAIYIVPLMMLSALTGFFLTLYDEVVPIPELFWLSFSLLIFTSALTVSRYIFSPPATTQSIIKVSNGLGKKLHFRFTLLLSSALLEYVVKIVMVGLHIEPAVNTILQAIFFSMASILLVWFLSALTGFPAIKKDKPGLAKFINVVLLLLLFVLLITEGLGFHRLALFIISRLFYTILILGAFLFLLQITHRFYQYFDNSRFESSRRFKRSLGIKQHHELTELKIIKLGLYLLIIFGAVISVLYSWGIFLTIIDGLNKAFINGFTIGQLTFVPVRIIAGMLLFSVTLLAGRFFITHFIKRQKFSEEDDTQEALASLTLYLFFALSVLLALVVAGVNFTGLAIIAGALSVGAGLGLQHIVNNFASGLILLLEKPIRPGDRIVIGETEGIVKKIRIRSTQIVTMSREDVIVPNSDLITQQVVNYMFRDRSWRISNKVGVAYGSDVELVKKVLLDVALANPEVMHDAENQPSVLFREFSASTLAFELWCVLFDVNRKFAVISDLNFAIDKAFRENNITIAFPQLDVHITNNS